MPTLKAVEENKKHIQKNSFSIDLNAKDISANRQAISVLQEKYVPYDVFEGAVAKYDKIVHRLIWVVCGIVALLFICNAVWIYAWHTQDFGNKETTMITNDGTSNYVGGGE